MRVLALVDYSYLYYKYKFPLDAGRLPRLTIPYFERDEESGDVMEIQKDVSKMFYSIKEIEGFRRTMEKAGHDVVMAVCFDMPSSRKTCGAESGEELSAEALSANSGYKSSRGGKLTSEDFHDMGLIEQMLGAAGHNTYRLDGFEADDLVSEIVREYSDNFDYTVIYTPDADLLVNIRDNVGAQRYKSTRGYSQITRHNYSEYLSAELKCNIPYNSLMLFKSTCGDASDEIAGIKGFGPRAFNKLVDYCENSLGVDWEVCGDSESTLSILKRCAGYLSEDAMNQALASFSLVRPKIPEAGLIVEPIKQSSFELRTAAYMPYKMTSLCK